MKKTYKVISSSLALLAAIFAAPADVGAQVTFQDNFDYPAGRLYGQGPWVKYGTNPNEPIQVVDQKLDYAGYPGGVLAKSVQLGKATSGEDLVARFDQSEAGITSGNLYYSALINVAELPTTPTYVLTLATRSFSSPIDDEKTGTELGRLYINTTESEGKYQIGVERGATKPVYSKATYDIGTTYLIVVKYEIDAENTDQDAVSLYVNPADFTVEPATPDAYFAAGNSGSSVSSNGLQGIELRQGSSWSGNAPVMHIGSLRVADTYAGLFVTGDTPDDTPAITLSESNLDFGGTYAGYVMTKTVNVKAKNLTSDITVSVSGTALKASTNTIAAADAQSEEGFDVTFTLTPSMEESQATVTFATDGTADMALNATWEAYEAVEMATLKAILAEDPEAYLTYIYKGEAVVTFTDTYNGTPRYYIQDETAGIVVSDDYGMLGTEYKIGDKLTGFVGMVSSAFGVTSFIPMAPTLGVVVSEGNEATPVITTLSEIKAAPADYLNRLVRIENASLSGFAEGATFAEGMAQPTITDATGEGKLRIFSGTSLIGTPIPVDPVNITGLSTSASAIIIGPRSNSDIEPAVVAEPSFTISPDKFEMAAGTVGKTVAVGTIHISAVNMPAETMLEITGKDRSLFSLSQTSVPAGSSETDIEVTYSPTAIGKNEARLMIDCPQMPEIYRTITLSAYAIDEQNPPTVTVEPEVLPTFEAEVGKSHEQTFTVTTANLPDFANMRVKEAGSFHISTTMLLKDNVTEVKVTFEPKEAGEYNNEIEIYGLAFDTVHIKISGKATEATSPEPSKEGDELPLDPSQPVKLLNEHFDMTVKNEPLSIAGWKNVAMEGTRAWWGYELPEGDELAGDKTAKVTAYDSMTPDGGETPCEMLLVTPPLDFKNSESKVFTFRVRGDYLMDNQTDLLELCYIDLLDGDMYIAPVEGFTMPNVADLSGEWQEYHINLAGQNIADVFFMGFRFKSMRGRNNAATYYIDDVSYGRTDLASILPSLTSLAFVAEIGKDAVSNEVTVSGTNLAEPIKLTIGGPNKSKFKLSASELPITGGKFTVSFNSDKEGVHEAYVKLSSRGAADVYVPLSVNNTTADGIKSATSCLADIEVFNLNGLKLRESKQATIDSATEGLPAGVYVVKSTSAQGVTVSKVAVN